ncbi:hypothetical protein MBLNU230_g5421t1 [Neophaeotheca triangularis]
MARTTRSKTAATASREEKHNSDYDENESEDTQAARSARSKTAAAFKSNLERFQYSDKTMPTATAPSITGPHDLQKLPKPTQSPQSPKRKRQITTTRSPQKKPRKTSSYAPPSTYAHLAPLTDILAPNLIAIFIGTNPGVRTAQAGHAYAHPSNGFWKSLHRSGCTDVLLRPHEDGTLPARYGLGNTNIVDRPSRDAGELSRSEMVEGAGVLDGKVRRWRPESVCLVGKGIWEAVWRWRYGRGFGKGEFGWGWQGGERLGGVEGEWEGAAVFVTSSTSGLSASLRPHEKEAIWRPFGEWVRERRRERGLVEMGDEGSKRIEEGSGDGGEGKG